jgi:N-acyl-D-amino-acid deacylase
MVRLLTVIWFSGAAWAVAGEGPSAQVVATGREFQSLEALDELMQSFLRDNELPGAALAVARGGRLVYSRGFGYADVDRTIPVRPDSLFRIASVSKPITAVATMRLVDEGKLKLEDRVFEVLPHRRKQAPEQRADPRLGQITIRHLLQHRGGWDRHKSLDPMFHSLAIAFWMGQRPPAEPDDVVRFMLGRKLDFDPGRQSVYSNFGYCVLGRVIEQVSGQSYERSVQRSLLQPLGIHSMRIGKTLPEGRAEKEVKYYTRDKGTALGVVGNALFRKVPRPYGAWYLEAMDAHGGWLGSAVDLVRFSSALETAESRVLSQASRDAMLARPAENTERDGEQQDTYYGLGWQVRELSGENKNYWHAGSLPGTSSLLVVRHDGFSWAVLFNSRDMPGGGTPAAKIDSLIHRAVNSVEHWPDHDLFSK